MQPSPNITDKKIIKELEKLTKQVNTAAETLKQKQETQYSPVVKLALESAKTSLIMVSEETKQEILTSIAKFTLTTPAPEATTAPNPKASHWLSGAIQRNQEKVDKNASEHPLMPESDTQPSMKKA